jgi:hypothetical protein
LHCKETNREILLAIELKDGGQLDVNVLMGARRNNHDMPHSVEVPRAMTVLKEQDIERVDQAT